MALFDHFPYTNFHEFNADWLMSVAQKMDYAYDHLGCTIKQTLWSWITNGSLVFHGVYTDNEEKITLRWCVNDPKMDHVYIDGDDQMNIYPDLHCLHIPNAGTCQPDFKCNCDKTNDTCTHVSKGE